MCPCKKTADIAIMIAIKDKNIYAEPGSQRFSEHRDVVVQKDAGDATDISCEQRASFKEDGNGKLSFDCDLKQTAGISKTFNEERKIGF